MKNAEGKNENDSAVTNLQIYINDVGRFVNTITFCDCNTIQKLQPQILRLFSLEYFRSWLPFCLDEKSSLYIVFWKYLDPFIFAQTVVL